MDSGEERILSSTESMIAPDDPLAILDRLKTGNPTAADVELVRQLLTLGAAKDVVQLGKYNINIVEGKDIHVGDRIYQGANAEAIRDIIRSVLQELHPPTQPGTPELKSVDELVQEVRSRLHNDIQRLHGTMPLWGVDHWVPLGELFVDVNILKEVSSNRRSELADLWQDFSQNPGDRGLDRMGLDKERQRVSGLEILAKNTDLMVVGKPGSGKTTYLQRVVTECNAGNLQAHRIPVLIRLREFVEDGRSLSYSLERYLEQYWQLSTAETQLVLRQGQSLVLLDGLDEVVGDDGKTIAEQIKQFARSYPQVQMVVTCRTQSFSGDMNWKSLRFSFVEVADFNKAQMRSFAEHWFKTVIGDEAVGLAKAGEFLEQLFREENKPIQELAITPILLSLTCAVFRQTGKFYSKRSKLYEEGLELMLEQWDKSREIYRDEIYRDLSVERKLELLSYLAVKKFEQPQYVLFEQAEIEGCIAEFLEIGQCESQMVLRAIESQHGLLIERSYAIWSFSHLTFQEYFVAKWLCKQENWHYLCNHIADKPWREIFFLVIDITKKRNKVLKEILKKIQTIGYLNPKIKGLLNKIKTVSSQLVKRGAISKSSVPGLRAFYFCLICDVYCRNTRDKYLALQRTQAYKYGLCLTFYHALDLVRVFDIKYRDKFELSHQELELSGILDKFWEFEDFNGTADWTSIEAFLMAHELDSFYGEGFNFDWWHLPAVLSQDIDKDEVQIILQQYDYANNLIIELINHRVDLSEEVKQQIIEKLFLPVFDLASQCKKTLFNASRKIPNLVIFLDKSVGLLFEKLTLTSSVLTSQTLWSCTACGYDSNPAEAEFCNACGSALSVSPKTSASSVLTSQTLWSCTACGYDSNPAEAEFCNACGSALSVSPKTSASSVLTSQTLWSCTACGYDSNPAEAEFCNACGNPTPKS